MRELRFLLALLQQITDGVHAREAAAEAYRVELAPFHGPMLQRTFRWGLWAGAGTEEVLAGLGGAGGAWGGLGLAGGGWWRQKERVRFGVCKQCVCIGQIF